MATYNKIAGSRDLIADTLALATDTFKVALTNTAPTATSFTPGTDDLATASGYTAGGNAVTVSSATESAGTYTLTLSDPTAWTFTDTVTFRYAVLVCTHSATPYALGYWDYGSSIATATSPGGDTFTFTFDAGALTIT